MDDLIKRAGKDRLGGALMILIGAGAAQQGITYSLGTLAAPGPGLFPGALGVLLMLIGLALAVTGKRAPAAARTSAATTAAAAALEPAPRAEWRGWFCIVLSIVAFIVLGSHGGLVPASFAVAFIAALGDRDNTLLSACVLGAAMAVVSVVVFWWLLQLQLPLFQWS
ncbi:tripartite tricarboxylate transporter TctB family protein [Paraburkholderia sp. ZP32-5]|uniref:tripartite tricarboxylate transporter TctB family protein n=1 Tax=Paraburkholderia sp. ZP32-5 TaxID=2883245 RepID=UPI001F15917A|nr:tripartite tricarboxylate transporter TctB family protein [Paraburkholderia sp. ZP32-5]